MLVLSLSSFTTLLLLPLEKNLFFFFCNCWFVGPSFKKKIIFFYKIKFSKHKVANSQCIKFLYIICNSCCKNKA